MKWNDLWTSFLNLWKAYTKGRNAWVKWSHCEIIKDCRAYRIRHCQCASEFYCGADCAAVLVISYAVRYLDTVPFQTHVPWYFSGKEEGWMLQHQWVSTQSTASDTMKERHRVEAWSSLDAARHSNVIRSFEEENWKKMMLWLDCATGPDRMTWYRWSSPWQLLLHLSSSKQSQPRVEAVCIYCPKASFDFNHNLNYLGLNGEFAWLRTGSHIRKMTFILLCLRCLT